MAQALPAAILFLFAAALCAVVEHKLLRINELSIDTLLVAVGAKVNKCLIVLILRSTERARIHTSSPTSPGLHKDRPAPNCIPFARVGPFCSEEFL